MGKAMAFSGVRVPKVPCSSHTHGEDPGPCPLTRHSYGPINLEMPKHAPSGVFMDNRSVILFDYPLDVDF